MKRTLVFGAVLLLLCLDVLGQEPLVVKPKVRAFELGLNAGYGLSGLNFPVSGGLGESWQLGLEGRTRLNDRLSLLTGLSYSKKGNRSNIRYPISGTQFLVGSATELHYLTLDLGLDIRQGKRWHVQTGVYGAVLTSAMRTQALRETPNELVSTTAQNIRSQIRPFDFGLRAGLLYDLTSTFSVGAEYRIGFVNVQPNANSLMGGQMNQSLMLTARIRLGK